MTEGICSHPTCDTVAQLRRSLCPKHYWRTLRYGRVFKRAAHRVVYTRLVGPIPAGMDLDHLCRIKHCVRPDHLEPVAPSENVRRGWEARRSA